MKSKKVRNEGSHQCCLKAKVDKYDEQFCESECNEAVMQLLVAQCGGASLALNVSPANQRQLHINSHCKLSVKGSSSGETFPIFFVGSPPLSGNECAMQVCAPLHPKVESCTYCDQGSRILNLLSDT